MDLCDEWSSAKEALLFLERNKIDLVFLDINMLNLSGLEMAQRLNKSIKVIFHNRIHRVCGKRF